MRALLLTALLLAATPAAAFDVEIGGRVEQGGVVLGQAPAGSHVTFAGHTIPVTDNGRFLLGIDRDAGPHATLKVTGSDGTVETRTLDIARRAWELERVNGVPQQLVTPDPVTEAKIVAEQKLLDAARAKIEPMAL